MSTPKIKITTRYITINGKVFEYRISDKDEFAQDIYIEMHIEEFKQIINTILESYGDSL